MCPPSRLPTCPAQVRLTDGVRLDCVRYSNDFIDLARPDSLGISVHGDVVAVMSVSRHSRTCTLLHEQRLG